VHAKQAIDLIRALFRDLNKYRSSGTLKNRLE